MAKVLNLPQAELTLAGVALGDAARGIVERGGAETSVSLESISGVGAEVDEYLSALNLARNALADAAKTASRAVSGLLDDGSELDSYLARVLHSGYAVGTGTR